MKRLLLACSLVALLGATPAGAQLDLSRYVALGDSTTAGFTHGGLVDCYQNLSWPAVLARQAGVTQFQMPLISSPGLPPLLQLVRFEFIQGQPVPVIVPIGLEPGLPYNAQYPLPYNNLGVPGANLYNLLFTTGDIMNLLAGNTDNAMHDLILRIPQVPNPVPGQPPLPFTAITQAIALNPTFVTLWIGNNDVLSTLLTGSAIDGVTMTPVNVFAQLYPQALGALVARTSAEVVAFTVLDVSDTIPFVTTVPPFVQIPGLGIVPIQGSNGPLTADSLVTLPASALLGRGYGIPLPGYPPLPEDLSLATGQPGYVLRPAEVAAIKARVAAFNQIIRQTASQLGVTVFDVNALLQDTYTNGVSYGGIELNADFLTGGLIGFDGIHKQQNGHAILAAKLIDFLNQELEAEIDRINLAEVIFSNPCAGAATLAKASETVFSQEAHQRLLDIFVPQLKRSAQARPEEPQLRSSPRGRRIAP